MSNIRFDRLRELCAHHESPAIGHKVFYFNTWTNSRDGTCGTVGCLLGEAPVKWKELWAWRSQSGGVFAPMLIELIDIVAVDGLHGTLSSAQEFFGLTLAQVEHLFLPNCQLPEAFGGRCLSTQATREEAVANVRAFIAKFEPVDPLPAVRLDQ